MQLGGSRPEKQGSAAVGTQSGQDQMAGKGQQADGSWASPQEECGEGREDRGEPTGFHPQPVPRAPRPCLGPNW